MSVLTQAVQNGFTDVKTIKFSDFTETVSGTEEVINIFTIPADSIVEKVAFYLVTNFDGASSTTMTLEVGDADDDKFIVASVIHEDGTEVSSGVNSGAGFNDATTDNVVNGVVFDTASDTTMTATFNPTGDALTNLTQGEVRIMAKIVDLSKDI